MDHAPYYSDIAHGPEGGQAYWLITRDGLRIRIGVWPGGDKGTVLMMPGRSEYIEKYGHAATELQARGFSSVALDWRGQGLAERLIPDPSIGHVGSFHDYQLDVDAAMTAIRALSLPGPVHLLAHSMGGGIGLRSVMERSDLQSAVFSAPMWGILLPLPVRLLAHILSAVSAAFGQGHRMVPGGTGKSPYVMRAKFATNNLTTDPEMFDQMRHQLGTHPDLALGAPSLAWLGLALRECSTLAKDPVPLLPTLTFLGTQEAIVDPQAIHSRMADWPNGQLEMIPDARHEVMMETRPIRDKVFDQIAAHFTAHS